MQRVTPPEVMQRLMSASGSDPLAMLEQARHASNAFLASSKLGDLFASLPVNDQPHQWAEIELTAQSLANDLRVRDGAQPRHLY